MPMNRATATKASQPNTAVFQWLALQRPMRAAMLFELFRGDMALLRGGNGLCPHARTAPLAATGRHQAAPGGAGRTAAVRDPDAAEPASGDAGSRSGGDVR